MLYREVLDDFFDALIKIVTFKPIFTWERLAQTDTYFVACNSLSLNFSLTNRILVYPGEHII